MLQESSSGSGKNDYAAGAEEGTAIAVEAGICYAAGSYRNRIGFGAAWRSGRNSGGLDFFAIRVDAAGTILSGIDGGTGGYTLVHDLSISGSSTVLIGEFRGPAPLTIFDNGGALLPALSLSNASSSTNDIFLLSSNGSSPSWTQAISSAGDDVGMAVVADASGIYVTGSIDQNATFPGMVGTFGQNPGDNWFVSATARARAMPVGSKTIPVRATHVDRPSISTAAGAC